MVYKGVELDLQHKTSTEGAKIITPRIPPNWMGQNGPPIIGLNPDGSALYSHEDGTISPIVSTGGPKTST